MKEAMERNKFANIFVYLNVVNIYTSTSALINRKLLYGNEIKQFKEKCHRNGYSV